MLPGVQGRDKRGSRSWVTHYHISYSEDAYRWEWARDIYGDKKVSAAYGHIYGRIYGDGITRAWSLTAGRCAGADDVLVKYSRGGHTLDWVDIAVLNFRHSPRHGRS